MTIMKYVPVSQNHLKHEERALQTANLSIRSSLYSSTNDVTNNFSAHIKVDKVFSECLRPNSFHRLNKLTLINL